MDHFVPLETFNMARFFNNTSNFLLSNHVTRTCIDENSYLLEKKTAEE